MAKQLKVEPGRAAEVQPGMPVFDRAVLAHHTMHDSTLAEEIVKLFLEQLTRLETGDWSNFDVAFEMHTLRGAAAAVGAKQLQNLAEDWRGPKDVLEAAVKTAVVNFRVAALRA